MGPIIGPALLTVLSNLLFGSRQEEHAPFDQRVRANLEFVGLAEKAEATAAELPYGDQRVLEIAIALAAEPDRLLLDEPLARMNDAEGAACMDLIHSLRDRGVTVVVIDHHMQTMLAAATGWSSCTTAGNWPRARRHR